MKKNVFMSFAVIAIMAMVFLLGCRAQVTVERPPQPKPRHEVRTKRPGAEHMWVWKPGHWRWKEKKHKWVWIPGHWVKR